MRSSGALIAAARAGDATAARSALRSLLLGQIARIEVLRGGHVLASAGAGPAVAPVGGTLPGTGGARYLLSVQSDRTYTQVTHQVTGAEVVLLAGAADDRRHDLGRSPPRHVPASGPLAIGARSFQVASLPGTAYPSGSLRIALLVPAGELACPGEPGADALSRARPRRRTDLRSGGEERVRARHPPPHREHAGVQRRRSPTATSPPRAPRSSASSPRTSTSCACASTVGGKLLVRPRRPLRARARARHAAQRRARRRHVLDRDPGRRRLPEARAPVHRRRRC